MTVSDGVSPSPRGRAARPILNLPLGVVVTVDYKFKWRWANVRPVAAYGLA